MVTYCIEKLLIACGKTGQLISPRVSGFFAMMGCQDVGQAPFFYAFNLEDHGCGGNPCSLYRGSQRGPRTMLERTETLTGLLPYW